MDGRIALVGGDEFRPGCEDMDRAILRSTGVERPSLLVVPTAADKYPSESASNGVSYFAELGAKSSALMVLDRSQANDPDLIAPTDTADVVYFTGGNPAHLLDTLRGSLLLTKIEQALERGAIVAGSSAGAMVMGPWMRFREWRQALGIAGVVTLPHHERHDPDQVAKDLADAAPSGIPVLGVDGKTACLGGPKVWEILGPGHVTVYQDGRWRRYSAGETLMLDSATSPEN